MNPSKLVLHFSDFSVIFYAIYKKQPTLKYYLSYTFHWGPWTSCGFTTRPLLLRFSPYQESPPCNVAIAVGRRGSGGIPTGVAAGPVEEGPGRSPNSPRSGWGLEIGRGNRRWVALRRLAAVAAASSTTARQRRGCELAAHEQLP
jgi:hypothetical protein